MKEKVAITLILPYEKGTEEYENALEYLREFSAMNNNEILIEEGKVIVDNPSYRFSKQLEEKEANKKWRTVKKECQKQDVLFVRKSLNIPMKTE